MVKEEYIIKIINNEFEKVLKDINTFSQANNSILSQQKIFVMRFYKNIELTKKNILLNIKKYFTNNKSINSRINQINQFTKFLQSKKRNKSQNILNFQTNANTNPKFKKNIFYSIIDGSITDLKKNHSYLSPSSNKKKINIKPIIIDVKNIRSDKGNNSINNIKSNISTTGINNNNNLNHNNSNFFNNSYNINNINSSEDGDSQIKVIFSKKNKNFFNNILNKSHSELKLRLKERNSYSSNKVKHQKKKISILDNILNNGLVNKDKNKKNLKILTNTNINYTNINADTKGGKNISFSKNPMNYGTQSFWKNNRKKSINKINLQKMTFKTKTEIINKKKKILNLNSNFFNNKNNKNVNINNRINNNSHKRKDSKNNNSNYNNNNSLNYNIKENYDDSINDIIIDLAKEIINCLDNLKNLQNSIIKKDSDIKKMKINFEMQKISLYQKAKNILDNNNSYNNKYNNNINESKLNISNNSKILNSTTVKSDSLSYINNYFGNNNIKNTLSGITIKNIKNKNNDNKDNKDSNTKELKYSLNNLNNSKKTIEDIKTNDDIINEQLKNEINILNNKLNENEKHFKKINNDNLDKIINIYTTLMNYSNDKNKNNSSCNIPSDKKFDWYIHKINEIIEKSGKEWEKINNKKENNKDNNINENLIKEQLYKATVDITNWLEPYLELNKDEIKKYILKLEEDFKNYGIKQSLNSLKSKIKELIFFLEINNINKKRNKNISNINIHINNIIDKTNFIKLNSVILNIQNNLIIENERKNNEIKSIKQDLNNSLKLNNKIIDILNNYYSQESTIIQEKYDYIQNLFYAEQDKVNLLQKKYMDMIEGLIDYIENGNKIFIELGNMWNIKPKKETNFEFIEPDSSELGYLNESDLLSAGSRKNKDNNNSDLEKYKEEIEQYKKVFKYLENKMNKYDNIFNNITNILIKIVKNIQVNQKQKDLFCNLFRILNIKDEKIISIFNNEEQK